MTTKAFEGLLGLVLLDLDGTVIDDEGNSHPLLPGLIRKAVAGGMAVGWISRTSIDGLRRWEHEIGIDPGLMSVYCGEEGAVTIAPPGWLIDSRDGTFSRQQMLDDHSLWKERYSKLVTAVAQFCVAQGWSVVRDHPSTWTRRYPAPPMAKGVVVCIDNTREVSFACEVRACAGSKMFVNKTLMGQFLRPAVQRLAESLEIPIPLLDNGRGWCDLPNHLVHKGWPTRVLRLNVPKDRPVIVIDNSGNALKVADVPGVTLVAVNDSRDGLQDVADHVTTAPGPAGVVEYFQNRILPAFVG